MKKSSLQQNNDSSSSSKEKKEKKWNKDLKTGQAQQAPSQPQQQQQQDKKNKRIGKGKDKNNNNNNKKNPMNDRRFREAFTNPLFQPLPTKQSNPEQIQQDERFSEMFTNPAFRSNYRIDRYGREIKDESNTALKRFYRIPEHKNGTHSKDNEGEESSKPKKETKQKRSTRSDSKTAAVDGDDTTTATTEKKKKPKLTRKQQKIVDEIRNEENNEIRSDDEFWEFWDKHKSKGDDQNSSENADEENDDVEPRASGQMFEYDAETTSSSDAEGGDGSDYTPYEIGEDMRKILDWDDNQNKAGIETDATRRLAIVNLDWDNVRAVDLYMVFRSFLPADGSIVSVSIHPSEYGHSQMEREEKLGPDPKVWRDGKTTLEEDGQSQDKKQTKNQTTNQAKGKVENKPENQEGEEITEEMKAEAIRLQEEMAELERIEAQIESLKQGKAGEVLEDEKRDAYDKQKLRKYELQRLRYFYALVEFDSKETADRIYQECDGREFQLTANIMDMRFVADDFVPPYPAKDRCDTVPDKYTPASDKATKCLGSTFVDLTWDRTDPNRVEVAQKSFTDEQLLDMDLNAYLETDGEITDAGFETDFPVTDYDTDTPDKKVKVKRRARARYQEILEELKEKIENTRTMTDDEQSAQEQSESEVEEKKKERDESEDEDEENEENKKDKTSQETLPAEVSKLEDWIAKQGEYKKREIMSMNANSKNPKKRSLLEMQEDIEKDEEESSNENEGENEEEYERESVMTLSDECNDLDHYGDDDDEPLVSDNELPPDIADDPYFQNLDDDKDQENTKPKKRRKLNQEDKATTEELEKAKQEMRAKLEMLMMDGNKDPEDLEYDPKELENRFNKRLQKDWRLRNMIKKATKKKIEEMDPFEFNSADNRFGALYEDPDFALDPTNPGFRRTRVMDEILEKTREKRSAGHGISKEKSANTNATENTEGLIEKLKQQTKPVLEEGAYNREEISQELKNKGLINPEK